MSVAKLPHNIPSGVCFLGLYIIWMSGAATVVILGCRKQDQRLTLVSLLNYQALQGDTVGVDNNNIRSMNVEEI